MYGYSELTQIDDELTRKPDIELLASKRIPAIRRSIADFQRFYKSKNNIDLTLIEDAAQKIAYYYFEMCYQYIEPVAEDSSNRFKMASLIELIIVQIQIFQYPGDKKIEREINAMFGMSAAFSFINCMLKDPTGDCFFNTNNNAVDEKIDQMITEHKEWLATKSLNELPIFLNAQYYELMEVICRSPLQMHGY